MFQLTNYLFDAEISYEIKGVRFDQMKISGRGTEPKKNWNDIFLPVNKRLHQFHMIKSNGKVTRKTRETYFFHRKPQKLKIAKKIFFENCFRIEIKNFTG